MLLAVQTLNATEREEKNMTLSQWYLLVLKTYRIDLLKNTFLVVADAAFSSLSLVKGLKETRFSLISRLCSNAVLYYVYEGSRTGRRGWSKTKYGKIDFAKSNKSRMTGTSRNTGAFVKLSQMEC